MGFLGSIVKGIASVGKTAVGTLAGSSPFGAIAGSALGAISNAAGDSQNQSNALALQQQGQQWQEQMIDKQNQWNSAPEQAKRYREAGINPVMALGGGSSGIVSSGGSAGTNSPPPTADSVAMSNEDRGYMLEKQIADADVADKRASAAKSQAEATTEDQSRVLKMLSLMKNNDLIDSETAKNKAQTVVFGNENALYQATKTAQENVWFEKQNQEVYRSMLLLADVQIAQANAGVANERAAADLANIYAQISLAAATGKMHDATAAAAKAGAYLNSVVAANQDFTPEQREQLLEASLKGIAATAVSQGIAADWATFEHIMNAVGNAAGAALNVSMAGRMMSLIKPFKKWFK